MATSAALRKAIMRVLTPLVRILLRHGISYGTFSDIAREVFARVALNEFGLDGRKQSISRVSVITGMTRKAVKAIIDQPAEGPDEMEEPYNRAARVLAGWRRDRQFLEAGGEPAKLPFHGDSASFSALVKKYSGDMPARAVLDELERVGAINRMADGQIQLMARAFLPTGDDAMKLHILGTDVSHLVRTIDHNLAPDNSDKRFQRKVSYDNLPLEALAPFKKMAAEQAQALLEHLDEYLSRQDRDANPQVRGTGRYAAGMGIYYFEESMDDEK